MGTLVGLLAMVVGLVNLILFIMVVIKLFQTKGVLHGILGIICSIYTFIWGWMNVEQNQNRNIMVAWTGCIIGGIVLNMMAAALGNS
jgi:hypothetical protein